MSASRAEFRGAKPSPLFFASQRVERENPIKPVKHDVPVMVVPTPREVRRLESKTPRQEMLTLPPVRPRGAPDPSLMRSIPRVQGSLTPRTASNGELAKLETSAPKTARPPLPIALPQLTFSTNVSVSAMLQAKSSTARSSRHLHSQLTDYVDQDDENDVRLPEHAATRHRREIEEFERRHAMRNDPSLGDTVGRGVHEHHTVTTIDEEASTRVLKVMFQLNLTRNSSIIARLKDLDYEFLHKKIQHELGYKKQMSRDEFYSLMCKMLKDDYVNRRDCMTLFSVFDDDKSGLVDAVEFVSGFMTLVAAGDNDIAFKFIHTVLDARGEKAIVNAFISRFELQLLVSAAQHHFANDPDIVRLLDALPGAFNFSHHLGRIPIMQFREHIIGDEDLSAIFAALPNPSRPAKEAAAAASDAAKGRKDLPTDADASTSAMRDAAEANYQHIVADQFMNQNVDLQQRAEEHGSPRWWVSGGIVYRANDTHPYGEPVFLKEGEKRR
jgi:hypothetical protein